MSFSYKLLGTFRFKGCLAISLSISLAVTLIACQPQTAPDPVAPVNTQQQPAQLETSATSQETVEKIKFKQGDGSEKYSLKFKSDGAKLVDGANNELARLTVDGNQKIKIKDATDQVLGYVVTHDGYWKLENAEQTEELYIFRRQNDGDFKLEDGSDRPIYRIKLRDYGYEIETPEKVSLYKVKSDTGASGGKISLRDGNDNTVLSTKSPLTPVAMASFGFDVLTTPQQAALAYAVHLTGGQ